MDKKSLINKLVQHEPLFSAFPIIKPVNRVLGTEDELGIFFSEGDIPIVSTVLPAVLLNGGEAYIDMAHVEICTPEVSNALSLVAYREACKRIAHEECYSPLLVSNNTDWRDKTFGSHENYFTCAPRSCWSKLLPFLVARTVIEGSGLYCANDSFIISQRALFLENGIGECTTECRSIINMRLDPLSNVDGWDRMHLICGDANMCQLPAFLKYGLTELVISMLEIGALPDARYDKGELAITDLHEIATQMGNWTLPNVGGCRDKSALSILSMYVNRARELFTGRDEVTDTVIALSEWVISELAVDPMRLVGFLDWPTKLWMLKKFDNCERGVSNDRLRALDLAYHDLDPERSLYSHMYKRGEVASVVSDGLIRQAMYYPPSDTRAHLRGVLVRKLSRRQNRILRPRVWSKIIITPKKVDLEPSQYQTLSLCVETYMPDPRLTYASDLPSILNQVDLMMIGGDR